MTAARLTRRLDRRPHPLPVACPNAKAPRSPGKRSGASSLRLADLSRSYNQAVVMVSLPSSSIMVFSLTERKKPWHPPSGLLLLSAHPYPT